jgi:hypothetical protein
MTVRTSVPTYQLYINTTYVTYKLTNLHPLMPWRPFLQDPFRFCQIEKDRSAVQFVFCSPRFQIQSLPKCFSMGRNICASTNKVRRKSCTCILAQVRFCRFIFVYIRYCWYQIMAMLEDKEAHIYGMVDICCISYCVGMTESEISFTVLVGRGLPL